MVVSSYIDMNSIPLSTITLNFTDSSQLELNEYTMDLSSFSLLKSFKCGDNSFNSVRKFIINGLNQLESIVIGKNSFTLSKNSYDERLNREFHVTNCASLRELIIDRYSFSDYHIFELNSLPNLKSITIGSSSTSYNFYYVENIEFSSLPSLENLYLGAYSFYYCHDIIFESINENEYYNTIDLPKLKSIQLQSYALYGDGSSERSESYYGYMNTLSMKSIAKSNRLDTRSPFSHFFLWLWV